MIKLNKILNKDLDSQSINTYWNFGEKKESKMHRIHSYPAKFPAFITTKAIEYAKKNRINIKSLADIFCGCGTTALEAKKNNIDYFGYDINPIATLIAKVKSDKYQNNLLIKYYKKIIHSYNNIEYKSDEINNINDRIKYWYFNKQIIDLLKIKKSIRINVPNGKYKNFFLCCFSNILKPTSRWLTKSIKPQLDPKKIPMDVEKAFTYQFNFMLKANSENDIISNKSTTRIYNINFLEFNFEKPFIDMIITSPPYVTSYEYADIHQLSTLWLDFTDDYRKLRKGTIGSIYNYSNFETNLNSINSLGKKIVTMLCEKEKRKAKSVAKYFVDIKKTTEKCWEILKNNGIILFVIGNTEYKNIKIDNTKYIVKCLINIGFKNIEIHKRKISSKLLTPYRDEKGKFTTNENKRKIYPSEFIIIAQKTI